VADVNGDNRDDLVALYDRGGSSAVLYRFISTGTKVPADRRLVDAAGLLVRAGAARAGDVNRDGRDDAIVL